MTFTIPLIDKPSSVKDIVFNILMTRYPLSLIELLNTVRKDYQREVSFQAVRKAVLQLQHENVLIREGKKFSIKREWILQLIKFGNQLQKQYFTSPGTKQKGRVEIGKNVTVYTLPSLVDLDYVWNGIIRESLAKPNAPKIITFAGVHFWFLISELAQETELMKEMIKKGIKLYYICYGNTPLDKWTVRVYNSVGVQSIQLKKPKEFEDGLNIGTYGDYVIQTTPVLSKKIDHLFQVCKKVEDVRLAEITDITTKQEDIQLTVQYDPLVAATFREKIIKAFKK